jgi:sialate O-acetylesterase
VHSDQVAKPVAVRFAWTDTAEPNLFNGAGLPASPFRTDDFPLVTAGRR